MEKTVKNQLSAFHERQLVMMNGVVRDKHTFEAHRITRKILFRMVTMGLLEIRPGGITLTRKGRDMILAPAVTQKSSAEYYRERRQCGYHSKRVWVHEDDLEKFERFVKRELRL